jgi:hypothetical protein
MLVGDVRDDQQIHPPVGHLGSHARQAELVLGLIERQRDHQLASFDWVMIMRGCMRNSVGNSGVYDKPQVAHDS